jgi:peptide/nickel transport system substrate-binding protein
MKKRTMAILCLTLAFVFVLAGCGNTNSKNTNKNANTNKNEAASNKNNDSNKDNKDEDKTEQSKAVNDYYEVIAAESPESVPTIAKNRKDTLIVGTTAPKGDFAPIYSSTTYDSDVCDLLFDTLISNDEAGDYHANMATWDVSKDGKTYTFHLKEGIKFSDGSEMTAEDVAFTFTAICDPKYDGLRVDAVNNLVGYDEYHDGDATGVSGIKVIDPYTISFAEKEVNAAAIEHYIYGIMPKAHYNFEKGDWKHVKDMLLQPIGSGQYILKDYKAGQSISFEANPNYWKGEPKIKNVIMKVTNADTVIQELKTGGVDIDRITIRPKHLDMVKSAGFLDVQYYDDNGYGYIGLNHRLDMFKDKKVRQALMYGLNRQGFLDTYYKGYAKTCNAPISQRSWAYYEDVNPYEYNLEKANQLLDEAGWKLKDDGFRYKDGKKFTIHWMTVANNKYVETLIPIVKENWTQIGVEVIPELMEFGTLCEKVYDKQEFEMYDMAWNLSIDPDPSGIFGKDQTELGGSNAVCWVNEESQKLMDEGLSVLDREKRKEIYQKWCHIANEELPYLYIGINKDGVAVSSRVKNFHISGYKRWTIDLYLAELEQ